jgi:hypothetical protein
VGLPALLTAITTRRVSPGRTSLILIAPEEASVPDEFRRVAFDRRRHEDLIARMQRHRAMAYLGDGAIEPREVTPDGRHQLSIDRESWHLLTLDANGAVCGCVRYLNHSNTSDFGELWLRNSALAKSPDGGLALRRAVENELRLARLRQVSYVEVGGWAISSEYRCTTEALRIALATYALAGLLGGCVGITTATVRHSSSSILRRIGGTPLESAGQQLRPYYDPQYRCEMEVLRFDSDRPAPKYQSWVDDLRSEIRDIPVVCRTWPNMLWCPARVNAAPRYQQLALPCPV